MHPAEIVCIVTGAIACFACCLVVGHRNRRRRPQMIDLDTPPPGLGGCQPTVAVSHHSLQSLQPVPVAASQHSLLRSYVGCHSLPRSQNIRQARLTGSHYTFPRSQKIRQLPVAASHHSLPRSFGLAHPSLGQPAQTSNTS